MSVAKKGLKATAGAGAAALLMSLVPSVEGTILRGYKDPIGIVTACTGHTKTAVLGRPYTPQQCEQLLDQDLAEHASRVMACIKVPTTAGERAAYISFDFNTGRFCGSTMARKLNAGDHAGACAELNKWVYAGGRVLPGLVKRRQLEREICEAKASPEK